MCAGLLSLSVMMNGGLRAEGVPPVIKYQAVLRDVEGEPMSERTGLAVRITLRQGAPAGTILYQETHTDLATDPFGLLLLEIGRGNVSNAGCASLSEVPWKNSPIYAQVEIQADNNGYTMMGASELLSVPYALYAGDAGVGFDLNDNYLPKYSGERGGLVNSGIAQFNDKITFTFENGDEYTFPDTRGKKGEVLMLTDDQGTLEWGPGGGGGGGTDCADCDDLKFVYWDATANSKLGALRTAGMHYDDLTGGVVVEDELVSEEATRLEGTVVVNATVSGDNNLQYNTLPQRNVWVGDANGKSQPHVLGSGVSINYDDPSHPILNFGGGVWQSRSDAGAYYVYTNEAEDAPGKTLLVGVGTGSTPKARFHMQGGSFLLSEAEGEAVEDVNWTAGNHFYWHSGKGALRMGKLEDASSIWADLAEGSIALGTDAKARQADNVAIGKAAEAMDQGAMVFGQTARADGITALALGTQIKVSGQNAIGIGSGHAADLGAASFNVGGAYGIGMGYDVMNEANNAIVIGQSTNLSTLEPNSIVLGTSNNQRQSAETSGEGGYNITIGANNKTTGSSDRTRVRDNVQMGRALSIADGESDINLGYQNTITKASRSIAIGRANTITMGLASNRALCIGSDNSVTGNALLTNQLWGAMLVGYYLKTTENTGVVLGRYNAVANNFVDGRPAALVVGVGTAESARSNALELSDRGELRVPGTVYCNGTGTYSDRTLKTDIQPLAADYSVLQALQPVRYRFKADEKQTLQFGFIAQEVEAYFPHLVQTDGKGLKSLNYIGLLPVLWQYTQRLEQTVETQAAEIDRLKTEMESLKADIQAVKAAMGMGE